MSILESHKLEKKFTQRQGEYLAFIFYYTRLNKRSPAEVDIQNYFGVSSASTHQMLRVLVEKQLIKKEKGKARSMTVLVPQDQLPIDW
ncbi:LexA family protein [Photobacterium profundum]|uniref:LexA family protein n=1 Tax=Photobacterium profundum TaxID=74109 RepID=UPI0002FFF272|nr:MarR family transcriptional regulator [Photobacterium profundum]